ncbi:hypothetical protein SAMN05518684_11522 [Salipaludibacillus aurantiacus]|uniref:DUF8042 domain-containing protein n=1 Tax=Salipaludibacillus aurantiacus TaxID=1601833 RepID=A0A1H9W868_9BACI|nr:hypothetical protein SAMN05518684_11522 [Salipaludibacillus aurantiacus]
MERHLEIMKQSLQLSETVVNGLIHTKTLLSEGKRPEAMQMLDDILVSYESVERSVTPVLAEMDMAEAEEVQGYFTNVQKGVNAVVTGLEAEKYEKVEEVLDSTLIPQFRKLNDDLKKAFQPYLT